MLSRSQFSQKISDIAISHEMRGVAFLWFYRHMQDFDERTASDLARDLHDEGFPRPNVTFFHKALTKSKYIVRGKRPKSFQLDVRHIADLDQKYASILNLKFVAVNDSILPKDLIPGNRTYLEKIAHQINGTYDNGWYDACAVLCRRLMESLIIEVYMANGRKSDIEKDGSFFMLDKLITTVKHDKQFSLGRNSAKIMDTIKSMGDTAAHDRVYITQQQDIDEVRGKFRPLINALLVQAKLK